MNAEIVQTLTATFEAHAQRTESGVEFWLARDIQHLLGYSKWDNFLKIVSKAKTACEVSGYQVADHFADVGKMVDLGSGSQREVNDLVLTRYACYLIAQNGDSKKSEIAFAQSYFAIQTRKQELLEERIALVERLNARKKLIATESELSKNIYERGVDDQGFSRIRSRGDQALFGGVTTLQMKKRLGTPENRALADFLPTITIKAKDLATEITNFNVSRNDLRGEPAITSEHVKNNADVRGVLAKSGIKPEKLLPEEDLKKLERRVRGEEKLLEGSIKKLKS